VKHALGALALTGLLAACSHLPAVDAPPVYQAQASSAHYTGRLAVRVENDPPRSFSANFLLEGNGREGQLTLSTALGTQLALARWLPGRVWLVNGDGTREFQALDDLARATLGEEIPLEAFFDWLGGRPWPQAPSSALNNQASGFSQLGWDVRLDRYKDGLLVAQRQQPSQVSVRAKLDEVATAP